MSLSDVPNLGPASERMLRAAGIHTLEDLEAIGAVEAYRRSLAAGARPSRNLLWALEATLLDLDWRLLPGERKAELLAELAAEDEQAGDGQP